jgi:hypothetical protein
MARKKNSAAVALGKKRWAGKSARERAEHMRMMRAIKARRHSQAEAEVA